MAKRKTYSDEFKREAVGLTRQPGAKVSQVARDIGVNANQLWRWRRAMDSHGTRRFPARAWLAIRSCWRSSANWRR